MDSKNTNDADQNVANLNSSQDIVNQNVTIPEQDLQSAQNTVFPEQNLQPVYNAAAPEQTSQLVQNLPLVTPSKQKRPILIACIVGVVVLTTAAVSIVCAAMLQDGNRVDDAGSGAINPDKSTDKEIGLGVADTVDVEKFKQMTKTEAMDFLQAGRNMAGSIPKGYVGEEITDLVIIEDNTIKSDVILKYSHDTMDDLRQIAEDWYGVLGHNDGITEDDYTVKEYDYYAIITPNRIEGTNTCDHEYYGDCDSLLSFKREYLNYYQEETAPHSYNDVVYLNAQDPELVEDLLRVYFFFYNYGAASLHGNIYGSSFEEQDDKFVLTVYYVGVGLNMEKIKVDGSDIEYAINLYSRQYAADKADGRLHTIRTGEDSTVENIKSIPVTQEEISSLLSR